MKKIGLTLGGGGAKGFAHIPILEVFDELGIKPCCITGTSIGAILGALYASGHSAAEIVEMTEQLMVPRNARFRDIVRNKDAFKVLSLIDPHFSFKPKGLIKGEKFLGFLYEQMQVSTIEELGIPFKSVATDFWGRKPVVFDSGDLLPAIRASMAIPYIFTPVIIDGKVLVDGEEHQMENVLAEAQARQIAITIVLDLIHVIHYLWLAGYALCDKDPRATEQWVRVYLERLLTGQASYVAAAIRRQATVAEMTEEARKPVDKCCDYLLKNQQYLRYHEYLAQGLPIATGVIEGTCRHLVQDRMGITGARWDVPDGEAVLKLRAIRASGDWDDYWTFHEQEELARNHSKLAA